MTDLMPPCGRPEGLREKIADVAREFTYGGSPEEFADRILALLQPKLEWRGRRLFFGLVETRSWIVGDGDRWDGRYGGDSVLGFAGLVSRQEARAAVEKAVKEALGWND